MLDDLFAFDKTRILPTVSLNIAKGTTDPGVDYFNQLLWFGLVGLVEYVWFGLVQQAWFS